ncbi:efflux RND transporter periplasmic adaptor subunit [Azotosporobacter soli]|uniref:efflux RND transporter periplasmic adaptor subunit n=1 Tax=Azotosporobacter soli TaxID=3055040 RepID=UPI0031FE929A
MKAKLLHLLQNKKRLKLTAICAVVVLLCGGLTIAQRIQSAAKPQQNGKQQTTVDVMAVGHTNLLKRISLTGQTVPEAQIDIAAKYQGKVVSVQALLGQRVEAGQVLIIQDTGDAEIAIQQNQAAYQQASSDALTTQATFYANLDRAKADYLRAVAGYERYKTLYEVGAVSREQLDTNQQQVADAKGVMDALANQINGGVAASIQSSQAAAVKAQRTVSAVEKQRDDLILRAPRSGMIGYRQVEVGNLVQAGQKLLSIVDNSNIYVDCQVSEQDLAAITVGMPVEVQLESLGKRLPGKVIYISPASDATSMAFSLRIALTQPDPAVKSGMFARTVINALLRENVVVVPKDAVLDKNGKSYVFVLGEENKVEQRVVEVGARGDQNVEIINGLVDGEQVAVNNLARLRPGMVIVPNSVTLESRGDGQ